VIDAELEQMVGAPADALWELVSDPRRLPEWLVSAEKVVVLSPGEVGMKLRLIGSSRGRSSEVDVEVTDFQPKRRFAWHQVAERVDGKPITSYARDTRFAIELEPQGSRTKVRLHAEQDPAGPVRGLLIRLLGYRSSLRRMALSLQRLRMLAAANGQPR
jgi:carbon monoxide dehydrogenase subunit G